MIGGAEMMMGNWSAWHWVMFAIIFALVAYPIGRILRRIGFSPFWSILAFVPLANIASLWILALSAWPRERNER